MVSGGQNDEQKQAAVSVLMKRRSENMLKI